MHKCCINLKNLYKKDDFVRRYKLTKLTQEELKKKKKMLKDTKKTANILPRKWVTVLLIIKTGSTKTSREGLSTACINCDSD